MTPFAQLAQLEKSAVDLSRIASIASRAMKGFSKAPGELASFFSGHAAPFRFSDLSRAEQIGNVLGHTGIVGGGLYGLKAIKDALNSDSQSGITPAHGFKPGITPPNWESGITPTHDFKPGLTPPDKSLFHNPFSNEGRSHITHNLQNVSESLNPVMSAEELRKIYGGTGAIERLSAMTDPFRFNQRMAERGGYQ
jgi:hypothetical protein